MEYHLLHGHVAKSGRSHRVRLYPKLTLWNFLEEWETVMEYYPSHQHYPCSGGGRWVLASQSSQSWQFPSSASHRGALCSQPRSCSESPCFITVVEFSSSFPSEYPPLSACFFLINHLKIFRPIPYINLSSFISLRQAKPRFLDFSSKILK